MFSRGLYIHFFSEAATSFLLSVSAKFITMTLYSSFSCPRRSAYEIAAPLENAVRAVAIARNNTCVVVYDVYRGTRDLSTRDN